MTVTCYAQPDKPKSRMVMEAFAQGCGGTVRSAAEPRLHGDGPVAFYGVRPGWMHLWEQAKAEGRDWYYLDNAWFDAGREKYFRVGVNALQSWSRRSSDGQRLAILGVAVRPWCEAGALAPIIVCRQSDEYMRTLAGYADGAIGWQGYVLEALRHRTSRSIVVRIKSEDRPLAEDLANAWLLVTHSSAAAVEALAAGVPVICTDAHCAAARFSGEWIDVETPLRMPGRVEWASRLADSQWTLEEMRAGLAWRAING